MVFKLEYNIGKLSAKIERRNTIKKVILNIISAILIVVAIINIILLYYNLKGDKAPNVLGIYFFNIISGSMQPELDINDVIVVKKVDVEELADGDIITFEQDKKTISHRIVEIKKVGKEKIFYTKGDNNLVADEGYVKTNQIYGKVVFHIPRVGKIVQYIQQEEGFVRTIVIIVIIFILISLRQNKKNKRKIVRKKYEIKRKREKYN